MSASSWPATIGEARWEIGDRTCAAAPRPAKRRRSAIRLSLLVATVAQGLTMLLVARGPELVPRPPRAGTGDGLLDRATASLLRPLRREVRRGGGRAHAALVAILPINGVASILLRLLAGR